MVSSPVDPPKYSTIPAIVHFYPLFRLPPRRLLNLVRRHLLSFIKPHLLNPVFHGTETVRNCRAYKIILDLVICHRRNNDYSRSSFPCCHPLRLGLGFLNMTLTIINLPEYLGNLGALGNPPRSSPRKPKYNNLMGGVQY